MRRSRVFHYYWHVILVVSTSSSSELWVTCSGRFSSFNCLFLCFCSLQMLKSVSFQPTFSSVRYFVMKSSNIRNIQISQEKEIWSTTPNNQTKLTKAFLENCLVILIFSVQGSEHFQVTKTDSFHQRCLKESFLDIQVFFFFGLFLINLAAMKQVSNMLCFCGTSTELWDLCQND